MRYVSLFSGIEAASVAWQPLGFEALAFSEIEPFCCAVLKDRFPDVPNLGDITKIDWSDFLVKYGRADIVVGGSPCQSFSIAGQRAGLSGESRLMFEYIRAVRETMPRYFIWENAPGALTSEQGNAFRQLLTAMDDLGYGLCWRVLDAQFYGVPQRRRRVFLVGVLGDTRSCAEILFERESLRWFSQKSAEKREALTRTREDYLRKTEGYFSVPENAINRPNSGTNGSMINEGDLPVPTLCAYGGKAPGVIYCIADETSNAAIDKDLCGTLKANNNNPILCRDGIARRLTPRECERLQGFPDDFTRIPWRGKPAEFCSDAPRYKAIGNSMCVNVMRWLGQRFLAVDILYNNKGGSSCKEC